MSRIKPVIVVYDPSQGSSQAAVRRGEWVARALGARLDLVICHVAPDESHHTQLNRAAKSLRHGDLLIGTHVVQHANFGCGIIELAQRIDPMLVIFETPVHTGLSRAFRHGPDWDLLNNCPAPVWLAQAREWPDDSGVLACIGLPEESDSPGSLDTEIMLMASQLAIKLNLPFHLFHTFVPAPMAASKGPERLIDPMHSYDQAQSKIRKKRLANLAKVYQVDADNIHVKTGPTKSTLMDFLTGCPTGLLVMGTIARNTVGQVLWAGTAQRVLDDIGCDLLVVKRPDFAASRAHGADQISVRNKTENGVESPPVWIP